MNKEHVYMISSVRNMNFTGSCECESCVERSALVAEMAEETRKLQQCWLELREDFKTVYRLIFIIVMEMDYADGCPNAG